jgi:NAD-specific glutamate dehydrogenase
VFHVVPHLLVVELPTNQSLESKDGVLRVHNRLSFSRQTNKTLAMLGERDDGGCCPCSFRVLDDAGSLALHNGDARVGRSQVNTDDGTYKIVNIA